MSVWPQELNLRPTAPRTAADRAPQGAALQPPLWRTMVLLAAIVVIGIVTGLLAASLFFSSTVQAAEPDDGSELPFPPTPSASVAGPTLQQSKHQRRVEASHLPKDAPNILIILLDDVGFGLPDTCGGPIHTPTLNPHTLIHHRTSEGITVLAVVDRDNCTTNAHPARDGVDRGG